jgi:hypothetical protein
MNPMPAGYLDLKVTTDTCKMFVSNKGQGSHT